MKKCILSLTLITGLLSTMNIQAEVISYQFTDHLFCGAWVTERIKGQSGFVVEPWVLGFVSGFIWSGSAELKSTDTASIFLWIDNYCKANPLETIAHASQELVKELVVKK